MIQETSVESYKSILDQLSRRQREVLNVIREWQPISNLMLSRNMNRPINTITPRVKELRAFGLVAPRGSAVDMTTNRRAILWGITYPTELF